jgi:RNA polymerase sigma factor (sigma-70 family)
MLESWMAPLASGQMEEAWSLFLERYRRLLFATIRRHAKNSDDVMDVFAHVCERLRESDFARLRQAASRWTPEHPLSTWFVAVVRNLCIDWLRHVHGRKRLSTTASSLPEGQRRIFEAVFVEQLSHVEAYEVLRSRDQYAGSFGAFLKELNTLYKTVAAGHWGALITEFATAAPHLLADPFEHDPAVATDRHARLAEAMSALSSEDRLAVQLYVIEGMAAEDVARSLGFAGPKAVYNRVYRALAGIRARLEKAGIRSGDL